MLQEILQLKCLITSIIFHVNGINNVGIIYFGIINTGIINVGMITCGIIYIIGN